MEEGTPVRASGNVDIKAAFFQPELEAAGLLGRAGSSGEPATVWATETVAHRTAGVASREPQLRTATAAS